MPLPVVLQSAPAIQLLPIFRGTSLDHADFFPIQLELVSSHYLSVSVGVPIMVLTSLLIFLFLPLFNWTLVAQSSAPKLGMPLLLDEGSVVIFKIFISLTIGQGQVRHSLLYCLVLTGVILGDSWEFL